MGRPKIYDHRNISHRTIALPAERAAAIKRAATAQGISSHALIQTFITAGLTILGENQCHTQP